MFTTTKTIYAKWEWEMKLVAKKFVALLLASIHFAINAINKMDGELVFYWKCQNDKYYYVCSQCILTT